MEDTNYRLNPPAASAYSEWLLLRLMLEFNGLSVFCNRSGWRSDEVARALGVPLELENEDNMRHTLRQLLRERYRMLREQPRPEPERALLESNLAAVAARLELGAVEVAIMRLALYMELEPPLKTILNMVVPEGERRQAYRFLAQLLSLPANEVSQALHSRQKLMRYGVLGVCGSYRREFDDYLQWGDTLDANDLDLQPFDEAILLRKVLAATPPPDLQWSDYTHIRAMGERILNYMRHALATRRQGVNLLLYGAPGTGKTEFAALLAQQLAIPAYTLAEVDRDGDALGGSERLKNAALAQVLLQEESALLVFDEIEDVFSGGFLSWSVAQGQKAWINRLLETNAVPMVWISNDVSNMDAAFVRRFDIALEMPDLPAAKKAALIEKLAAARLAKHEVRYLAEQQGLTAAMLTRSFQVASSLPDRQDGFGAHVFDLLSQTLQAQGRRKLVRPNATQQAPYSLDWVACDQDLQVITRGLQAHPHGRICCYGPPGTGKTAWAHRLGEILDMPVLVRKGSDLLGKYVGENEQNIAAAFASAVEQNGILVIDEADSFLFERDTARYHWECSMANEMLTQMEDFEGLLVVSTNLMHNIDHAALRRFDVKIAFGYLQPPQILALAEQYRQMLQLPRFTTAHRQRLQTYTCLTPGDFAAGPPPSFRPVWRC